MNKKILNLFLLATTLILSSCGSSGSGDGADSGEIPDVELSNPIVVRETFGEDGNLWKPASDGHSSGAGNLVVLLSAKFTKQFESCSIKKNTGETEQLICINDQPWSHVPFSCFSNGGRQTWRANFKCWEAGEVKVTCKDTNQEVVFAAPAGQGGAICNRFG